MEIHLAHRHMYTYYKHPCIALAGQIQRTCRKVREDADKVVQKTDLYITRSNLSLERQVVGTHKVFSDEFVAKLLIEPVRVAGDDIRIPTLRVCLSPG